MDSAERPTRKEMRDGAADRRERIIKMIQDSLLTRGFPPSIKELAAETGVTYTSVRKDLVALEEAGRITRTRGVYRSIRVIRP